jgi:hypothetical protein
MGRAKAIGFTGTQQGMTPEQTDRLFIRIRDRVSHVDTPAAHHGDCVGADAEFDAIARQFKCKMVIHPPLNTAKEAFCFQEGDTSWPPLDYIARNHQIVDLCDVLYAAPAGFEEELRSGTWSTIRYACKVGRETIIIWPDGLVTNIEANAKDYDTLPQFTHVDSRGKKVANSMELQQ